MLLAHQQRIGLNIDVNNFEDLSESQSPPGSDSSGDGDDDSDLFEALFTARVANGRFMSLLTRTLYIQMVCLYKSRRHITDTVYRSALASKLCEK
jgi:hypothetical protein